MPKIFMGVLAALILTLLASGPQPAAALTFDFGTLSPGDSRPIGGARSGSGANQVLDTYLFKVSTAANVESNGFALNGVRFVFTSLAAELIEGTDVNCTVCNVLATSTPRSGSQGLIFDLVYSGLVQGTQYFLRTLGSFGESFAGAYTGNLTISAVSPVPIPPALLLFATAIVCAAALARRRAKRDAKA